MYTTALAAILILTGASQQAPTTKPEVISTGKEVALAKHLALEQPTLFVFLKPTSTMERAFLDDLVAKAAGRAGIRAIHLTSGSEPVAGQYDVKETPTAFIYDRRGRLVARTSDSAEIDTAARKAMGVARIDWAEEGDARYEEARKYLGGRPQLPAIMRTMSLKPEYMRHINDLSRVSHFAEGFLTRRTKEMISTYVSALNKCKY